MQHTQLLPIRRPKSAMAIVLHGSSPVSARTLYTYGQVSSRCVRSISIVMLDARFGGGNINCSLGLDLVCLSQNGNA